MDLRKLIKMVVVPQRIEIGEYSTILLKEFLPAVKKELGIDFDRIEVYPGAQPRESADINLYKDGRIVGRISVKTCVRGNVERTYENLRRSVVSNRGMNGMLVLFVRADDEIKMVVFYIPWAVFQAEDRIVIDEIKRRIEEKGRREGYREFRVVDIEGMMWVESLMSSVRAEIAAENAKNAAENAKNAADKSLKEIRRIESVLGNAISELRGEIGEILKIVQYIKDDVKRLEGRISRLEKSK